MMFTYLLIFGLYVISVMPNTLVIATNCSLDFFATDQPQLITSPGYPIKYDSNLICVWRLRAVDPDKIVVLETLDSMIHYTRSCTGDYVVNYNTLTPCSHDLVATSSDQTFSSPGYPVGYFINLACEYTIETMSANERILLDFVESDIEAASGCQYDSVKITDVGNGNKHDIATFCGSLSPTYQSATQRVKVKLTTDGSKVNKGFTVKYKTIPRNDCTVTLTATDMDSNILSPGYPTSYYSDLQCQWTVISQDPSRHIELMTTSSKIDGTFPSCSTDKVTVKDSDDTVLGTFCGSEIPSYNSSGSTIIIAFTTDGTGQTAGFVMRYKLIPLQDQSVSYNATLNATSVSKALTSPGYPVAPLRDTRCVWTIQAEDANSFIYLLLQDMDIEFAEGCRHNSIRVYEGPTRSSDKELVKWCGQSSGQYVQSSGPSLVVDYLTDDSSNGRGFSAVYYTVREKRPTCDYTLTAKDTVSHLSTPRTYYYTDVPLDCTIVISADEGKQIKVDALYSNLRGRSGVCDNDYVTAYEGSTIMSTELLSINTKLTPWCGNDLPTFVSNGSHLLLVFHKSPSTLSRTGFLLEFSQGNFRDLYSRGCTGLFYATSDTQNLTSPNYPNNYENNMYCKWTIRTTTSGKYIRISTSVKLEMPDSEEQCVHDVLHLYQGGTTARDRMSTACGDMTALVQSTDEVVYVIFATDSSITSKGFHMQFFETSEQLPCDSTFTAKTRHYYTVSEGYSVEYKANRNCTYLFKRDQQNLRLEITEYNNDYQRWDCRQQYLNIYEGPDVTGPLIGRYCGSEALTVTSGTSIFVQFVPGSAPVGKGFRIEYYKTGEKVCPLTTKSVRDDRTFYLTSPNYPFKYQSNLQCLWHLSTSSSSNVIRIQVLLSDIEFSLGCTKDYAEAYDGDIAIKRRSLGRWCGSQTPSYTSTYWSMTIVFQTDGEGLGQGFKISYRRMQQYTQPTKTKSTTIPSAKTNGRPGALRNTVNTGAIVGGVAGAMVVIVVVVVGFLLARKFFGGRSNQQNTHTHRSAPQMTYNAGHGALTIHQQGGDVNSTYGGVIGQYPRNNNLAFTNVAYNYNSPGNAVIKGETSRNHALNQNQTADKKYAGLASRSGGYDNSGYEDLSVQGVTEHGEGKDGYQYDNIAQGAEGHTPRRDMNEADDKRYDNDNAYYSSIKPDSNDPYSGGIHNEDQWNTYNRHRLSSDI